MSQLRQDPVTLRWVVIAPQRARRPHTFSRAPVRPSPPSAVCPFCPGHEALTPPEVYAIRAPGSAPNAPGWLTRVVPNLYPAFGPPGVAPPAIEDALFRAVEGVGIHEVVIISPAHQADLGSLDHAALVRLIETYRSRYQTHCANATLQYLLIVSNHGREAGASIEHPHSQIFGLPLVPPAIQEEIGGINRYRRERGRCVYCDIIASEQASGKRVIFENGLFLVDAPFASRVPFETTIIPRWHTAHFEQLSDEQVDAFAEAVHQVTARLVAGLHDPPFNLYIHTAPCHAGPDLDYHWHLDLLPRLTIAAGFELGSGIMINTLAPEDAAAFLRGVTVPTRSWPTR